jgi:uncharacterized RDD family membrane protein YckC
MPWYYEVDRQQRGPVGDQEFAALVANGTIRPTTLVWKDGWANWRAHGEVAATPALPPGAPSLPPPAPLVAARPQAAAAQPGASVDADHAICAVSGQVRLKRDMLEFEGRWVSAEHKEAFFQRLREGVLQPGEMNYAGFWWRVLAHFLDGIFIGVVNAIIVVVLIVLIVVGNKELLRNPLLSLMLQAGMQIFGLILGLGYELFFMKKYDATPGKLICGMRVYRADGAKLSTGRIIGRFFAEIVSGLTLGIGYLICAFDEPERRALHDRIADTRVLKIN